ncbi:MAG: DUF362 domain-containing protein, partial [Promethearchaeota archaeon]
MHMTNLADAMMDLWSVIRADLSIADLIRPMEGFGPHTTGNPVDLGCVVASQDPVALDATVCRMVGLDIAKVDYFKSARDRGIGFADENRIEIKGNNIKEVYKQLDLPYLEGFKAWPEYNFHIENACSSCQGLVAFTMAKLKLLGEYEKNKGIDIVVGRKKEIPEGVSFGKNLILMGDCTKNIKKKIIDSGKNCLIVLGCPPLEAFPYWAIVDRKNQPDQEAIQNTALSRKRLEDETKAIESKLKSQKESRF